jgi:hypothetical protein
MMNVSEAYDDDRDEINSEEDFDGNMQVKAIALAKLDYEDVWAVDSAGILASVTKTWADSVHSPIFYFRSKITLYSNGKFKYHHYVENRSGHSDWDIWIKRLWLQTRNSDQEHGNIATSPERPQKGDGAICFQDLDHGENWTKEWTGESRLIRDNWQFIADGTWRVWRSTMKRRDN